jgi:hypothetical protein
VSRTAGWDAHARASPRAGGERPRAAGDLRRVGRVPCWARCRSVRGGVFNTLVSAQCTNLAPLHGTTEFVHYRTCRAPRRGRGRVDVGDQYRLPRRDFVPDQRARRRQRYGHGLCGGVAVSDLTSPGPGAECYPVAGFACRARSAHFEPDGGWHAVRPPDRRLCRHRDGRCLLLFGPRLYGFAVGCRPGKKHRPRLPVSTSSPLRFEIGADEMPAP